MRSHETDTGTANASSAARYGYAAFLLAVFVGLGWVVPIVGLVAPTGVVVTIMMLAPVACGWAPATQGAVAAAGVAGYVWCVAGSAALPERLPSVMIALGIALVGSVLAASLLETAREAEQLQRQRMTQRMQQALAGLEIRAGVGNLTKHAAGVDVDDPVTSIEKIAQGLGRARVDRKSVV